MANTRPDQRPATRALIPRLQADAAPVRRLWSPMARFGLWLILVALVGATRLGLSGVRPDLLEQLRDPVHLLETALLALAGMRPRPLPCGTPFRVARRAGSSRLFRSDSSW